MTSQSDTATLSLTNRTWLLIYFLSLASAAVFLHLPSLLKDKGTPLTALTFQSVAEMNAGEKPVPVSLPHNWRSERDQPIREGWYTAAFEASGVEDNAFALAIASHRSNAAFYVNDIFVGDGGRFEEPIARNAMHPKLFLLPKTALHEGTNTLRIRLVADPPGHGFLGAIIIAPYKDIRKPFAIQSFFAVTLQQIATLLVFTLGLAMTILWLSRMSDRAFAYFAWMTLAWTFHNLNTVVSEIPVPLSIWDPLVYLSLLWLVVFACLFAREFVGRPNPQFRQALLTGAGLLSLATLVLPSTHFYGFANNILTPLELGLGVYAVFLLGKKALSVPELPYRLLTIAGSIVILFGVHDFLVVSNLVSSHIYFLLPYSEFVLLGTLAAILIDRFLKNVETVAELNETLEERVRDREQALTEAYRERSRLEQSAILEQERQRLMREMHDGLGGHLVSILSLAEDPSKSGPSIKDVARRALRDMRLLMTSLGYDSNDLPSLLGAFREQVLAPLETAGIEINWQVQPVGPIEGFGPASALHILRILQESVANAVKHSDLKTLTLILKAGEECRSEKEVAQIILISLGQAIASEESTGYGIKNMTLRAENLGATLSTRQGQDERGQDVYTVTLTLPKVIERKNGLLPQ